MPEAREDERTGRTSLWKRVISLGFRLLYHELAWSYDLVAWLVSFGQWQAWGQTALPYLTGKRILELGHGPGHLLGAMVKQGFKPVGLDSSPQMSRIAQQRLRRAGLASTLVRARTQTLPFPARTFDSVVAAFPTAYIADPDTLTEVARVLRPGGRVVVVAGAQLSGQDPLSRFIEWLYYITGQRETIDTEVWTAPLVAAGLNGRAVKIEAKRSHVFLLVAERATQDERG